jgi:hypothetical protein
MPEFFKKSRGLPMKAKLQNAIKNNDLETALGEIHDMAITFQGEEVDLTEAKEVLACIMSISGAQKLDGAIIKNRAILLQALMDQFRTLDPNPQPADPLKPSNLQESIAWQHRDLIRVILSYPKITLPSDLSTIFFSVGNDMNLLKAAIKHLSKEQAQESLFNLLNRARYVFKSDAQVRDLAVVIAELLKQHPEIDINHFDTYVKDEEAVYHDGRRLPYDGANDREPNVRIPRMEWSSPIDSNHYTDWAHGRTYSRCTPLMIAVLYNMTPLLDLLLAHPKIDVTAGQPYTHVSVFNRTLRQKLVDLHVQQFHDKALKSTPDQLKALYTSHEHAQFSVSKVVKLIQTRVDAELKKAETPEVKITFLIPEIAQLEANSALNAYLEIHGDKKPLLAMMQAQLRAAFDERAALMESHAPSTQALARISDDDQNDFHGVVKSRIRYRGVK